MLSWLLSKFSWEQFTESVREAEKLARLEDFDYLGILGDHYPQLRRYLPAFLEAFEFKAAPAAQRVIEAIDVLKKLPAAKSRSLLDNAPTEFIRRRWTPYVFTSSGLDRRYYELCALGTDGSFDRYWAEREALLRLELEKVDSLAARRQLPDAEIVGGILKVTPLANAIPEEAQTLIRQAYALLPHVKITDLLLEVDRRTALPSQRFKFGGCRHRAMEHGLSKTRHRSAPRGWLVD